jgi:TATA-box binding protein (TBP) (component of TFIID and TFIIIB)
MESQIAYKISTMTASASYGNGVSFNLDNVGKYLEIDDTILGIKYNSNSSNVVLKGEYLTSSYTRSKNKNLKKVKTTLFYNQISMIVNTGSNTVNVKLFGNGSLHLTGIKDENEPKIIMDLIMDKLTALKSKKDTILLVKDSNGVFLDSNNMIYSQDHPRRIIGYVTSQGSRVYVINKKSFVIDPFTRCFISVKMEAKRTRSIFDLNGNYIGYTQIELVKNKLKLYKKNSNVHVDNTITHDAHDAHPYHLIYYDGDTSIVIGKIVYYLSQVISTTDAPDLIQYEYSCDPFETIEVPLLSTVDINCINIFFDLNYQINRQRLYDKLVAEKYICEYKPEKYSGVKFIYKLNDSRTGRCICTSKCVCQNITFLIFQSGNVIVTGCKTRDTIAFVLNEFDKMLGYIKPIIQKRLL